MRERLSRALLFGLFVGGCYASHGPDERGSPSCPRIFEPSAARSLAPGEGVQRIVLARAEPGWALLIERHVVSRVEAHVLFLDPGVDTWVEVTADFDPSVGLATLVVVDEEVWVAWSAGVEHFLRRVTREGPEDPVRVELDADTWIRDVREAPGGFDLTLGRLANRVYDVLRVDREGRAVAGPSPLVDFRPTADDIFRGASRLGPSTVLWRRELPSRSQELRVSTFDFGAPDGGRVLLSSSATRFLTSTVEGPPHLFASYTPSARETRIHAWDGADGPPVLRWLDFTEDATGVAIARTGGCIAALRARGRFSDTRLRPTAIEAFFLDDNFVETGPASSVEAVSCLDRSALAFAPDEVAVAWLDGCDGETSLRFVSFEARAL